MGAFWRVERCVIWVPLSPALPQHYQIRDVLLLFFSWIKQNKSTEPVLNFFPVEQQMMFLPKLCNTAETFQEQLNKGNTCNTIFFLILKSRVNKVQQSLSFLILLFLSGKEGIT